MWSHTKTPSQPASSASAATVATTRGSASSSKIGRNRACLTLTTRLPEDVTVGVGDAGQDEEQVGQPVQVEGGLGVGALGVDLNEGPDRALGTTDDGARDVEQRGAGGAAREDE